MVSTKHVVLLSLLMFLVILIESTSSETTLQQVHVLFRHGARTPSKSNMYPKDPYVNDTWYPMGLGALTNLGKQQEYEIGRALRSAYDFYLGEIYTPNILYARSTEYPRTRMSMELVLAGLWPPTSIQQWNSRLLWQPIPYDYESYETDKLLGFPVIYCEEYEEEYEKIVQSEPSRNYLMENAAKIAYVNENSGLNVTSILQLFHLYLGLLAEETEGKVLPEWTRKVYPDFLRNASHFEYHLQSSNNLLVTATGGPLVKKVIQDAQAKITGKLDPPERKIFLYSGHEYNVAFTLSVLRNFEPHVPLYGSYIVFELHKIDGQYGFKIFYQDYSKDKPRLLTIKGCEEFCPFEKFVEITKDFIPDKKWCT